MRYLLWAAGIACVMTVVSVLAEAKQPEAAQAPFQSEMSPVH